MQLRVYQEELITKTRAKMREGAKRILIVAPCGAGKTILSTFMCAEHAAKGGHVLFVAHRQELLEQAHDTFRQAGQSTEGVDILSVQTAGRRIGKLTPPTMIVIDEAHHAAAGTWKKLLSAFPQAWVVGLTATPCRLDGRGLGDVFEHMVTGITTGELIAEKYLAPYRYYAPTLADAGGLQTTAGDYNRAATVRLMDTPAIIGDAVAHYKRIIPEKQAIVYCAGVAHSKHMAQVLGEAGIRAAHLDGDTPVLERRRIINAFRKRRILALTNVDLLGEGFDVPACDATIMLRPTKSTALFIQQSMRCMRYEPGKQAIIIDHVGNATRHGFPDDPREWMLDPKPKKRKKERESRYVTCEQCYCVYEPPPFVCPGCGEAPEKSAREALEQRAGILVEITEEERKALRMRKQQEVRSATSYGDLVAIAKERGYSRGWCYHIAKQRGWVV